MNENVTAGACCPHCEHELTPEEIKSLWSKYTLSRRQAVPGPKRQKRACPSCETVCESAREAWSHCRIPRNLEPEALLTYVLERMPLVLAAKLGKRFKSLETLRIAVAGILGIKPNPALRKQAQWYAGYIERAVEKLEDVA